MGRLARLFGASAQQSPPRTVVPPTARGSASEQSLNLIYDVALAKIEQQMQRLDALDTKAIGLLTAAALIVTVSPGARLTDRHFTPLSAALLAAAGVLYAFTLIAIGLAFSRRKIDLPPSVAILYEYYRNDPPAEMKHVVIETIMLAYQQNEVQIARKVAAVEVALWLLVSGSIVLGLAVILS